MSALGGGGCGGEHCKSQADLPRATSLCPSAFSSRCPRCRLCSPLSAPVSCLVLITLRPWQVPPLTETEARRSGRMRTPVLPTAPWVRATRTRRLPPTPVSLSSTSVCVCVFVVFCVLLLKEQKPALAGASAGSISPETERSQVPSLVGERTGGPRSWVCPRPRPHPHPLPCVSPWPGSNTRVYSPCAPPVRARCARARPGGPSPPGPASCTRPQACELERRPLGWWCLRLAANQTGTRRNAASLRTPADTLLLRPQKAHTQSVPPPCGGGERGPRGTGMHPSLLVRPCPATPTLPHARVAGARAPRLCKSPRDSLQKRQARPFGPPGSERAADPRPRSQDGTEPGGPAGRRAPRHHLPYRNGLCSSARGELFTPPHLCVLFPPPDRKVHHGETWRWALRQESPTSGKPAP
ncbi:hypothetical protein HJG60_008438 [Phyllostomus discolor]|uniref:Uncharacterized protein n=1 Tax=Phyllostomus discolor TaxID=89673 RepID=A0A833Z4N2_9CHIR|nr:hypothetical protein HJG60_008438 [Phyllostomus discolor]